MNQANSNLPIVYLLPGQGADERLFNNLKIDQKYEVKSIRYHTPNHGEIMKEYAKKLAAQIEQERRFILIGVSLGGMLVTEFGEILSPEKNILISSAKSRKELPWRYRFQRSVPLYKLFPSRLIKFGAQLLQPLVEPDRNNEKSTFVSMLKAKDPLFLKRTIEMIIKWERIIPPKNVVHIHGDNDKTIPPKNVEADFVLKNGSHMMVLTRGKEISEIIRSILP